MQRLVLSCLLPLLALGSTLPAQTAPVPPPSAPPEEERVELSPFVIEAEQGWVATESVSGTRLRTELRDVPSQIETFTKDFMDDLALNSIEEALIYSVNAENNFEFVSSNAETSAFYTNDSNRVRGLTAGTRSQNLFRSAIAPDNYNVDSASLISGPNSILFGMGGASGTFDSMTARAIARDRMAVRLQYSSEDSRRATIDINRVLLKDRLSFRLMALRKNELTSVRPNHDRDNRYTLALTARPLRNTTLRVRYEKAERDTNRAARTLAYDFVTPWLKANQVPGSPYSSPMPGYDNRTAIPANIATTSRIFAANNASILLITDSPDMPLLGWGRAVQVQNPSATTVFGVPDASFDSGRTVTFFDETVFPADRNAFGELKKTLLGGETKTVFLEQRLAKNLFLELAFNREESYQNTVGTRGQGISAIYADANQFLPALYPGETTYRPNPNFGRYYTDVRLNHNPAEYFFEDFRATLSYELDLQRERSRWLRWLGRHRAALVGLDNEAMTRSQLNFVPRIYDNPVVPGRTLTTQTATNWAINATREVRIRSYLDSSFDLVGLRGDLDGFIPFVDATGQSYQINSSYDSGFVDANGKRLANASSGLNGSLNKTRTWLLAHQAQFLPDRRGSNRVIVTFGYREDKSKSAAPDVASRTQDAGVGRTGLYPLMYDATWDSFGAAVRGITRNHGVVVRPLPWISLSYNESATFDVATQNYNPFGERFPGSGGEGKDYGVRLDLFDRRIAIRLNKFENAVGPARAANNLNDPFRAPTSQIESRVRELDPALAAPSNWFSAPLNYGYDAYHVYSYRTSEGYELSIDLQPLRQWSIRINGSKTEAKEDDIGRDWRQWLQVRLPVWKGVVAKNGEVDANGRPVTWETADANALSATENRTLAQYFQDQVLATSLPFMEAAEGRVSDGARGLRANLVTTYRFNEGRLRGVSVGGALRWRRAPVIGYPVKTNEFGTKLLDVENGFRGEEELPVDLTIGYRGRMKAFKGVGYSVQLNVRNVLDDGDIIPVTAFSNGVVARMATVEPRLVILSFGFDL